RVNRIFALAMPSLLGIMNLSTVAVLWFGGHLVDSGAMPIGNLTAFLMYIFQILFAVMMAVFMVILVPRAEASAQRIEDVVRTIPSVSDPATPVEPERNTGMVEMRDVTFAYPHSERAVLHDLSIAMRPGTITGIIGGTGSGKTTLLTLVTRGFDATGGAVLVDGVDVREQSLDRLWSRIGLVPQTAYLFDDCFSALDAATDARLRRALRAETGDASVVIVAQRVSTILHADQIVVLDEGRVVGIGTHDELMAGCVEYREIVESQLGEA